MTETSSKSRQQAEKAFARTQVPFFGRDQAVQEQDSIIQARDEKTLRLRTARKAKELQDTLDAANATPAKRGKRA